MAHKCAQMDKSLGYLHSRWFIFKRGFDSNA
jgi:hypothetical protein